MFEAMRLSTEAANVADAQAVVQSNVRDTIAAIVREVQIAAKADDTILVPPVLALRVVSEPAPDSPVEIVFQVPEDGTGQVWSSPIRFRYIREEDGGNGIAARRIVRLQDRNGDGTFDGPGESIIIGASNDLSDVQFALADGILRITIQAQRQVAGRQGHVVSASQTEQVYLLN